MEEQEEAGEMAMATIWPEVGLSSETLPAFFDFNDPSRTCSLESFVDKWMREDSIHSMAEMEMEMEMDSIPTSCVDLCPMNREQQLSSCDFHLRFENFQQQSLPSTSFALSLDSIDSTTTAATAQNVSDSSENNSVLEDLRKIIVKKPVLDKAVEKLGGGKVGALKLWNLIQVWLSHRRSSSERPPHNLPDLHEVIAGRSFASQSPLLSENEQQEIGSLSAGTGTGSGILNVIPSAAVPTPALDLRIPQPVGSEQHRGIAKPRQKGLVPLEGLAEAMDVTTVSPIIDAVTREALVARSCPSAATTRAARKNRMARQRRSSAKRNTHSQRAACAGYRNSGLYHPQALQFSSSPYTQIARTRLLMNAAGWDTKHKLHA